MPLSLVLTSPDFPLLAARAAAEIDHHIQGNPSSVAVVKLLAFGLERTLTQGASPLDYQILAEWLKPSDLTLDRLKFQTNCILERLRNYSKAGPAELTDLRTRVIELSDLVAGHLRA